MKTGKNKIKPWSIIKDEVYGKKGTKRRDDLEQSSKSLAFGLLLRKIREDKQITQEQLAAMIQKKRSYISRVENNSDNITLKSLYALVEGLGAKLHISIEM